MLVSLTNLMTFPFVAEAVAAGRLQLHGVWKDIRDGGLEVYDADTGDVRAALTAHQPEFTGRRAAVLRSTCSCQEVSAGHRPGHPTKEDPLAQLPPSRRPHAGSPPLPAIAAEDPIAVRQALMDTNGAPRRSPAAMLKDELAYSPAVGKAVLSSLDAVAAAYGDYFPEGTLDPERQRSLAEDLGGRGRLRTRSSPSSGRRAAAASEASGKDGPADKAAFQAAVQPVLGNVQVLPRGLPHSRTEACGVAVAWLAVLALVVAGVAWAATMPRGAAGSRAGRAAGGRRDPRRDDVLGRRMRLLPRRARRARATTG